MPRGLAQVVSAATAVSKIPNRATVAISGFIGAGHPEALTSAIERRFLAEGAPLALTAVYCAGQGDGKTKGIMHFAHAGLLKRVVGGHWGLAPKVGKMALAGEVEGYNLPQGVICHMLRDSAAKRPGTTTKIGLNTFIDPINGGGKLNDLDSEPMVERVEIDGETYLRYKPLPVHVGLIRGTAADRFGNVTMDREAVIGEVLPIAQAAKNHGGIVIAQVERVVDHIADPKAVKVPGILVDYVVEASADEHMMTFGVAHDAGYVANDGQLPDLERLIAQSAITLSGRAAGLDRSIIGRRALAEIREHEVVNLGVGLPEAVASEAAKLGRLSEFALTVEAGLVGGVPAAGLDFGCSRSPHAVLDQPAMFDFYDGGGLDIAVLGAAEIDAEGSVNVGVFAGLVKGVGGFVNISSTAKRLVFCCTLRAGGLAVAYSQAEGRLSIESEGKHAKFVHKLPPSQVCFHGPSAIARGQEVLYVTERAVFRLTEEGLRLEELAPGISEADVLPHMGFTPLAGSEVRPMAAQHFES